MEKFEDFKTRVLWCLNWDFESIQDHKFRMNAIEKTMSDHVTNLYKRIEKLESEAARIVS
jgi:hypothetical protein